MAFPNCHNEEMDVQILNLGWSHTEKKISPVRICAGFFFCSLSWVKILVAISVVDFFITVTTVSFRKAEISFSNLPSQETVEVQQKSHKREMDILISEKKKNLTARIRNDERIFLCFFEIQISTHWQSRIEILIPVWKRAKRESKISAWLFGVTVSLYRLRVNLPSLYVMQFLFLLDMGVAR